MPQIYWFYRADDDPDKDGVWHAYRLTGPRALCDSTAISYGVDPVADAVPEGGKAHKACQTAIAKEEKEAAKAAAAEA